MQMLIFTVQTVLIVSVLVFVLKVMYDKIMDVEQEVSLIVDGINNDKKLIVTLFKRIDELENEIEKLKE